MGMAAPPPQLMSAMVFSSSCCSKYVLAFTSIIHCTLRSGRTMITMGPMSSCAGISTRTLPPEKNRRLVLSTLPAASSDTMSPA